MKHFGWLFPHGVKGQTPVATTLSLNPATVTVHAGDTATLTATVLDQFGQPLLGQTVTWSSSAPSVATVNSSGVVMGVAVGSATVTATCGAASDTTAVTINAASTATTVAVSPSTVSVAAGSTASLTAQVSDQYGMVLTGAAVIWSTTDTGVATVSSTGLVTGIAAGSCTITAAAASNPSVTGNAACTVTASGSLAFSQTRFPHSSTQLPFAYTDFRESHIAPGPGRDAEVAFLPTHIDKLIGGGVQPASGWPAGMLIQPYTLMLWVETCVTDAGATWDFPLIRTEKDYIRYCAAHGLDQEDGYLHYAAGQTSYTDRIMLIDSTGLVTLRYDTQTYANAYANGDHVTITGAADPAHNGTWTISGLKVFGTQVDVNGDKVLTQTQFTIPVTGHTSSGTSCYCTRPTEGTKTKRNRLVIMGLGNFPPSRWVVNPLSSVRRAYELDRLSRILSGTYSPSPPTGVYTDETAENATNQAATIPLLEYPTVNTPQFYLDMASLGATLHTAHPQQWGQEWGIAGYTSDNSLNLYNDGTKCGQGEGLLYSRNSKTNWAVGGHDWTFVKNVLAGGSAIEMSSPYFPTDNPTGGGGNYASDPVPPLMTAAGVRMTATMWALCLLVYDPTNHPGAVMCNAWNGAWGTGSLKDFWLTLLEAPLGLPTADAVVVHAGEVTDPLGQLVYLQYRTFQGGMVVYRSDADWSGVTYDDTSAFSYTPPASSATSGLWCRTRSDGTLAAPAATFTFDVDEALILQPDPGTGLDMTGLTASITAEGGALVGAYHGSVVTLSGSSLTAWPDVRGAGFGPTLPVTTTNKPAYNASTQGIALTEAGAEGLLYTGTGFNAITDNLAVVMVMSPPTNYTAGASSHVLMDSAPTSGNHLLTLSNDTATANQLKVVEGTTPSTMDDASTALPTGTPRHVFAVARWFNPANRTNSTSGPRRYRLTQVSRLAPSLSTTAPATAQTNAMQSFSIGQTTAGASGGVAVADLAAILVIKLDPARGYSPALQDAINTWAEGHVGAGALTRPAVPIAAGASIQTAVNANPVGTVFQLAAGTYSGQSVTPKTGQSFIGDPGGGTILDGQGTVTTAFQGNVNAVTLKNLTVTNYVPAFQAAAIEPDYYGSTQWRYDGCQVHHNAPGSGIYVTDDCTVINCRTYSNGQLGIIGKANRGRVLNTEIDHNNTGNNDINNAAGGLKILNSDILTISGCNAHDNTGTGLWVDGYVSQAVISGNTCTNNTASGIMYEISYSAVISGNTVTGNGIGTSIAHGAILIAESRDVEVSNNTLSGNQNSIIALAATRSAPPAGLATNAVVNLNCHDNTVTQNLSGFAAGIIDQIGDGVVFGAGANNAFTHNSYALTGAGSTPFGGKEGSESAATWRSDGYDTTGTFT